MRRAATVAPQLRSGRKSKLLWIGELLGLSAGSRGIDLGYVIIIMALQVRAATYNLYLPCSERWFDNKHHGTVRRSLSTGLSTGLSSGSLGLICLCDGRRRTDVSRFPADLRRHDLRRRRWWRTQWRTPRLWWWWRIPRRRRWCHKRRRFHSNS